MAKKRPKILVLIGDYDYKSRDILSFIAKGFLESRSALFKATFFSNKAALLTSLNILVRYSYIYKNMFIRRN